MRIVADATIPITAAARPESVALTHVTSPCTTYSHERNSITKKLGSTNAMPARRPPRTLCRSHPT